MTEDPEALKEVIGYEGVVSLPQDAVVQASVVTHKSLEPVSRCTDVRVGPSCIGTVYNLYRHTSNREEGISLMQVGDMYVQIRIIPQPSLPGYSSVSSLQDARLDPLERDFVSFFRSFVAWETGNRERGTESGRQKEKKGQRITQW